MKKVIAIMTLVLAGIVGVSAQTPVTSQSANEGFVGVTVTREDVVVNPQVTFEDTDTVGINAAYTRYFGGSSTRAGVVGLGAELGYGFGDGDSNQVTALGTVTVKARNNKHIQPYVRGLAGVARQNVSFGNVRDLSDWSSAFGGGVGTDIKFRKFSRYGVRFGVDYLNTGYFGEREHGARFVTGIVF